MWSGDISKSGCAVQGDSHSENLPEASSGRLLGVFNLREPSRLMFARKTDTK
jgi:hypothetical protein